jgi:hypothetical protein
MTMTACPAIVMACDCALVVVFGETVTLTVPLPSPAAGEIETVASLVVAVHAAGEHPAGAAVTLAICEPPPAATLIISGETLNPQPTLTVTA